MNDVVFLALILIGTIWLVTNIFVLTTMAATHLLNVDRFFFTLLHVLSACMMILIGYHLL